MKTNPNDPIAKTILRQTGEQTSRIATEKDIRQGELLIYLDGLTKLEAFTMAAMQGLCNGYFDKGNDVNPKEVAEAAVFIANATIKALNESQP